MSCEYIYVCIYKCIVSQSVTIIATGIHIYCNYIQYQLYLVSAL